MNIWLRQSITTTETCVFMKGAWFYVIILTLFSGTNKGTLYVSLWSTSSARNIHTHTHTLTFTIHHICFSCKYTDENILAHVTHIMQMACIWMRLCLPFSPILRVFFVCVWVGAYCVYMFLGCIGVYDSVCRCVERALSRVLNRGGYARTYSANRNMRNKRHKGICKCTRAFAIALDVQPSSMRGFVVFKERIIVSVCIENICSYDNHCSCEYRYIFIIICWWALGILPHRTGIHANICILYIRTFKKYKHMNISACYVWTINGFTHATISVENCVHYDWNTARAHFQLMCSGRLILSVR